MTAQFEGNESTTEWHTGVSLPPTPEERATQLVNDLFDPPQRTLSPHERQGYILMNAKAADEFRDYYGATGTPLFYDRSAHHYQTALDLAARPWLLSRLHLGRGRLHALHYNITGEAPEQILSDLDLALAYSLKLEGRKNRQNRNQLQLDIMQVAHQYNVDLLGNQAQVLAANRELVIERRIQELWRSSQAAGRLASQQTTEVPDLELTEPNWRTSHGEWATLVMPAVS